MRPPTGWTDRHSLGFRIAAGAALSFVAIVIGYFAARPDSEARSVIALTGWTWASAYAGVSSLLVRRDLDDAVERRGLAWIAAGCFLWFLGQLADDWSTLHNATTGLAHALAPIGYVGVYPCLVAAVAVLLRPELRRTTGLAVILDTLLLTFTSGVMAVELLSQLRGPLDTRTIILGIAGGLSAIVLLWTTLVGALHRTRTLRAAGDRAFAGLLLFAVGSVAYSIAQVSGRHLPTHVVMVGWTGMFFALAALIAWTPKAALADGTPPRLVSEMIPHLAVILGGLAGLFGVAVIGMLRADVDTSGAVLVSVGGVIVAVRLILALRADQAYAHRLERDVERHTRSLSESYAAAAAAERNLRLLMEAVPDAIVVLDRNGQVSSYNPSAEPLVAGQGDAGRAVFDFLRGSGSETAREHLRAAFQGETRRFEVSYGREGARGVSAVIYAPIRSAAGIEHVIALARDISEQRRIEAQLQQSDKLAALGQLVSGVAHEINNPAAIVSGFAQTLLLDELNPEQREMVEMIRDEAMRIGRITSNLLAFARSGGSERDLIDVNDVVRRTYALRSYHLTTLNITVAVDLDPETPVVWGNGPQLQQMLLNLMINAEQALAAQQGNRSIALRTSATADTVRLEVADSGPGVPAAIQAQIFDPFFTTKPVGVGTGLGLSICYGIVQDHGGRISLESRPGHGATFIVQIPRDTRPLPRASSDAAARPATQPAGLRVLLVDDEPALREAARRFLERSGIATDVAADGQAALEAISTGEYDVIISDVRMPGMNGRDFVSRLRKERPELLERLILSTGDTFAEDTAGLVAETGVPTLVKPFDFDTLERMVRKAAGRGENRQ